MQDIEGAVFHQRLTSYRDELGGILKLSPYDLREKHAAKAQETQPSQPSQASQPPQNPHTEHAQQPSQASQPPQNPHTETPEELPEPTQLPQTTSTAPKKARKQKGKIPDVERNPKKKRAKRKVAKVKKTKSVHVTGNKLVDMLFKDSDPKFHAEIKEKYNQYSADVDYRLSKTIDEIRGNEDMLTTTEVVFGYSRLAVNTRVFLSQIIPIE
jgi:hypothetical protein